MAQISPSMKQAVASHSRLIPYVVTGYSLAELREMRKKNGLSSPNRRKIDLANLQKKRGGRKGKSLVPSVQPKKKDSSSKATGWFF